VRVDQPACDRSQSVERQETVIAPSGACPRVSLEVLPLFSDRLCVPCWPAVESQLTNVKFSLRRPNRPRPLWAPTLLMAFETQPPYDKMKELMPFPVSGFENFSALSNSSAVPGKHPSASFRLPDQSSVMRPTTEIESGSPEEPKACNIGAIRGLLWGLLAEAATVAAGYLLWFTWSKLDH
jgi:hypothetical protein